MKFLVAFGILLVANQIKAEAFTELETRISYNDDCEMTFTGTISVKVCGSLGCCYTPWIQGDFDAGRPDFFSGPSQLEECNNFEFMDPDANTDIDGNLLMNMVFFHQGTDAGCFESMSVSSDLGNRYTCNFDEILVDDNQYLAAKGCTKG